MGRRATEAPDEPAKDHDRQETRGELIVTARPDNPLIPAPGETMSGAVTSFDRTSPAGRVRLFNVTGESDLVIGRDGYIDLNVSDWVLYRTTIPNEETGELVPVLYTCLITPDGRVWKTTSEVMPDRLWQLIELYGGQLPADGARCQVLERKSRRLGRTYHDLRLRPEPGE